MNSNNLLIERDNLISEFSSIVPYIKSLSKSKSVNELNNLIEGFLLKAEKEIDNRELLNLSMKITQSDIGDKMKIKLLLNINIIMYKLQNNKVLKAEKEEVSKALAGIL